MHLTASFEFGQLGTGSLELVIDGINNQSAHGSAGQRAMVTDGRAERRKGGKADEWTDGRTRGRTDKRMD